MKVDLVALACAVTLTGCAATPSVKSVNGEMVKLHVSNMPEKWIKDRVNAYDSKLSPDLFDYSGQYFARYVGDLAIDTKIKEPGIGIASSLRNASMSLATSDLLLRSGTLGATSLFSKSFNAAGILLGAISPRSPEEQFVGQMNANYQSLMTTGVTFIRVDPLTSSFTSDEIERVFDMRFVEMRAAGRAPGLICKENSESIVPGFSRVSSLVPLECHINESAFKYLRRSEVAAPGSFFYKLFGPSVISRLTLKNVTPANMANIVQLNQQALGQDWVPIYPELGTGTVATKIVVGRGTSAKRYDPPAKPFSS